MRHYEFVSVHDFLSSFFKKRINSFKMYFLVKSYVIIEEANWKQVNLKGSQFQLSAAREILRHTFECIHIKARAPRAH
jgi:hypothetical protein